MPGGGEPFSSRKGYSVLTKAIHYILTKAIPL